MAQTNLFKQLVANNLTLSEAPFPSELSMEAFLMDNPQILKLPDEKENKDYFDCPIVIGCEISLPNSSNNSSVGDNSGRLDMLIQYAEDTFAIAELKNHAVNQNTTQQLCGYLSQKEHIITYLRTETDFTEDNITLFGILIGTEIAPEIADFLPARSITKELTGEEYYSRVEDELRKTPVYAITLSRFRNEQTGDMFVLANTPTHITKKDNTRYIFQGNKYNKGKLVNAVISAYVQREQAKGNGITLEDINKFPKPQNGQLAVAMDEAKKINSKGKIRYFVAKYKIQIQPKEYIATSSQWTLDTINRFIKFATSKGFTIKETE
ncbi:MAG: hypothetical protein RRY33_07190 [Alistipes sp.]